METELTTSPDSNLALGTHHDHHETLNMATPTDRKKRKRDRRNEKRKKKKAEELSCAHSTSTPIIETQPIVTSAKSTSPDVEVSSPQYPKPPSDFADDSDVEGTIITQDAQAILSRRVSKPAPKVHLQALAEAEREESGDEDLGDSDGEHAAIRPHRPSGFPPLEELPEWFPRNIMKIYEVDRHGGALSFKELQEITRYRAALEIIRRRKWKTYIEAGEARYKLQKILRRLRARPLTKAFLQYRKKQYQLWKSRALRSWKRLEKTHLGVSILDSTIDINFRQERIIYEKKLGGRL